MKFRTASAKFLHPCLFALAAVVAALLAGALAPAPAFASQGSCYVKDSSSGSITYYSDKIEALKAAYGKNKTLVLLEDWNFNEDDWDIQTTMGVDGGKELTIDMNGHRISNTGDGSVIHLYEDASLTLTSSKRNTWFTYDGYNPEKRATKESMKISTGGLVTGGRNVKGGGIYMEDGSSLTLDGVTVAGNDAEASGAIWETQAGGGICANKNCTVELTRNARVQNNYSWNEGGGIYLNKDGATVIINGGRVDSNRALQGGGIFSDGSNSTITVKNNGVINGNVAKGGGGVFFNQSKFSIVSEDKTGTISNNKAISDSDDTSGGGIFVDSKSGENSGVIKGLKISDNYSAYDAGAIELDQESTTVSECTITGNTASRDAGAIYVNNDKCTIDGCIITGNVCNLSDSSYEGGGVFVSYRYDIKMTGVCTITGNTRVKRDSGDADDVFLGTISGGTGYAYITGGLAKGSSVGVRTGIEGDRRIGKNIKNASEYCFFMDLDGYYVTYGTDDGGDMWQRRGTKAFLLKVDDVEQASYTPGSTATATAKPAEGKFFWKWDLDATEGFHPASSVITEDLLYEKSISFTMPQNPVNLVGVYGDKVTAGTLTFASPSAGTDLPETVTFTRTDGGTGGTGTYTVKLSWYKIVSDAVKTPTSGKAEYGVSYMAYAWVDSNQKDGLVFADNPTITVKAGNYSGTAASTETSGDGSVLLTTPTYRTAPPAVTEVEPISVTVKEGTSVSDFIVSLPASVSARTNAGTSVTLGVDTSRYYFDGIIQDHKIVKPASGSPYTGQVALKGVAGVNLPEDMAHVDVLVTVTDAEPVAPATPTTDPAAGTYSTTKDADKFVDGKLKVTASCATSGAAIKYRVDYYDGGTWVKGDETEYTGPVYLDHAENAVRIYDLVVWSEKDGLSSEAASVLYFVDDAQMKTVTVNQADTGMEPATTKVKDYEVQKGKSLTVTATKRDGYVFEKWLVGDEIRTGSTLTLDSVDDSMTVTAVYNPVVSEIDIDVDVPAAHAILTQAASSVKVKAGGSNEWTDITSLLSNGRGNPKVTWAPEGDDEGRAAHVTAYTASLPFVKGSGTSAAKYVLDEQAAIYCKGVRIEDGSAYIAKADDGTKTVCIAFPATGPIENTELETLSDVSLSYEEAWSYQVRQDAGEGASWSLPKEIAATSKTCGCAVPLTIEWNAVAGFDKSDPGAQELTATGTVVYPSYIDHDGLAETVTVKVKVAAAKTVAAPKASIGSGTYAGTQAVELGCDTDDATVRYTTDGSEPTEDSPVYGGAAIQVAHNVTVKAKAFRDGWVPSETATFEYAITHKVTFDAAGGSAVEAQTVADGGCATEPAAPTRKGYDFKGWTLDGAAYDFSAPVTGDLTLVATWEKNGDEPDVDPDDPDADPDADPDGKGDKGDGQSDGKGGSSKRKALPGTGDASAVAGIVAASGAALAALGARSRRKR